MSRYLLYSEGTRYHYVLQDLNNDVALQRAEEKTPTAEELEKKLRSMFLWDYFTVCGMKLYVLSKKHLKKIKQTINDILATY